MLTSDDLSEEHKAAFPYKFSARYEVAVSESGFRSGLVVTNTGDAAFDFQALLHTYYNIEAVGGIEVSGLDGLTFHDKVAAGEQVQPEGVITVTMETDRIYKNAPASVTLKGLAGPV